MSEHILHAYEFEDGRATPLSVGDQTLKDRPVGNLVWVHLNATHPTTASWLQNNLPDLDQFIIDALIEDETRPRMMQVDNGALLILRGVNLNENADPEDMVSIRLWVDQHRIVSLRRRRLKAIGDIKEKIEAGSVPKSSGDFICMLASKLFERMEHVFTELDEQTDCIEEQLLEVVDSRLRETIVDVRKQAIMFRRYMAPQRDAINQLRMSDLAWLGARHKHLLQESYNSVTRYVEDLDAIRERAQIVKDELANILADKLNKNMYVLSVIAAIFLPLGFLTGLLGINVGGIPGSENENAFWIFCGLLTVLIGAQIILFKRLKWF